MPPSDLAAHETSLCENAVVACPYCHQVMPAADFRDQHDCPEEPVQCGMCKMWHPGKDALKHEIESQLTFKYKCEICNSMVLFCKRSIIYAMVAWSASSSVPVGVAKHLLLKIGLRTCLKRVQNVLWTAHSAIKRLSLSNSKCIWSHPA